MGNKKPTGFSAGGLQKIGEFSYGDSAPQPQV
jgi:hypothetical protein